MTQNPPPHSSARATSTAAVAATCDHCGYDDRWVLHNVRLRGKYLKLCTSCVLKLHPTSFCPTCFCLHEPSAIPSSSTSINKTLTCFKCSSLSHLTCVPPNVPKSPYLCPPCSNPSFKFFDFQKPRKGQSNGGDCSDSKKVPEEGDGQAIDERAAKIFLAAARIAASSMNKAAAVAKVDAERRVKEAAVARKRAKEAIDHVMALSARMSRRNSNPNLNQFSNGVMMGRANNGVGAPPDIKNVGHQITNGPMAGLSGPSHLQNGGNANGSDKNHGRRGGGGTGP